MMEGLSQTLLGLLPVWGPWLVGASTFLSCLALPLPSSLLLIAAGAFVGAGDLDGMAVAGAALAGYVSGDQVAFTLGRAMRGLGTGEGRRARLIAQALTTLRHHGGMAVFLSRWLISPLAPWMTLAAGASGYPRAGFTVASLPGAAIWIGIYLGLGIAFGANLQAAADLAGSALGLVAAGALTLALGWWLIRSARKSD